uniref:Adhesion G protein-coupled receptor G4b n=1 Tax=Poecilia formosa TaxID=48698 RepID=A0A096LZM4_POEFO
MKRNRKGPSRRIKIYLLSFVFMCCLANSASTSLWGKKLEFKGPPCLWQLHPEVSVPALTDLSICIRLKRTSTAQWTGFLYRSAERKELGLEGNNANLKIWLFGKQYQVQQEVSLKKWHSICLTWSGKNQTLKVYLNEPTVKNLFFYSDDAHQQLAENGTLTLGVSHSVHPNGELKPESGNNLLGEIGLFRMWGKEFSAEEVSNLGCADGDVVSWDLRQWKYDCPPVPDSNLTCGKYVLNYKVKLYLKLLTGSGRNHKKLGTNICCHTISYLVTHVDENLKVKKLRTFSTNFQIVTHFLFSNCSYGTTTVVKVHTMHHRSSCCHFPPCDRTTINYYAFINHLSFSKSKVSMFLVLQSCKKISAKIRILSYRINSNFPILKIKLFKSVFKGKQTNNKNNISEIQSTLEKHFTINKVSKEINDDAKVNYTVTCAVSCSTTADAALPLRRLRNRWNLLMFQFYSLGKSISSLSLQSCQISFFEKQDKSHLQMEIFISLFHLNSSLSEPKSCLEEDISSLYGRYVWPETFPQVTAEMGCRKPVSNRAYRLCKLDIETDTTSWDYPNMKNCDKFATVSDISNITVTPDNAAEVVDIIQDLVDVQLSNNSQLSSSELGLVMKKLSEVFGVSIIEPKLGVNIVNIVANILLSETDVTPVADIVLDLTDQMGNSMEFQGESIDIKSPALVLSMINVDPDEFSGLTFGVSVSSTLNPEIFVNQSFVSKPLAETNVTISLPAEINNFFPPGVRNTTRVQFHFYGTPDLFQDPYLINEVDGNWTLHSFVVSASVNNSQVLNLKERVVVTLKHEETRRSKCVFWDFQKYSSLGGWSSSGCETWNISPHQTSCLCDHLTHFGVLLDVSRDPLDPEDVRILTVISHLGCGISSIFLGITLLTYLIFEKLRQDYPSKILINLSTALLGLTLLFLINSWLASFSNHPLCITTAAFLHYFLLASCTWMGLEAFHMYFVLVKVFNTYVPAYLLKFCAVGWGIPLVIVGLVLAIDKDAYGSSVPDRVGVALESTEQFCWIQNNIFYYVTVVGFILLIFLGNMGVFIVVLIQIKKMRANKPLAKSRTALQDLRAVASLTVLLGLTWSLGFFSFGPVRVVMMYLFAICNSFQGKYKIVFHCLMKENVRKQWKAHLCCGRFRVNETSDWSRSVTVDVRNKKGNLVKSDS